MHNYINLGDQHHFITLCNQYTEMPPLSLPSSSAAGSSAGASSVNSNHHGPCDASGAPAPASIEVHGAVVTCTLSGEG